MIRKLLLGILVVLIHTFWLLFPAFLFLLLLQTFGCTASVKNLQPVIGWKPVTKIEWCEETIVPVEIAIYDISLKRFVYTRRLSFGEEKDE